MRILAVDDDPFIIQVLGLALGAMGFSPVATAQSAQEAMDIVDAAHDPFDCILLDIQMPGVGGIELCSWLRKRPLYRRAPIIMLTAMSERDYIDRAFEAGATDYITKPFETVELAARIRVAEQLLSEIKSKDGIERQLADMTSTLDFQPAVDLEDALSFDDMPGHLELPTFKNYLERIKRSNFRYGGVIALKIINVAEIYRGMPARDYLNFIADLGDAVSVGVRGENFHFSYAGSGYFLLLAVSVPKPGFAREIRDRIQAQLDEMDLRHPDNQPLDVRIEASRVQGTQLFATNTVEGVIEAAINDVELMVAAQTKVQMSAAEGSNRATLRLYR